MGGLEGSGVPAWTAESPSVMAPFLAVVEVCNLSERPCLGLSDRCPPPARAGRPSSGDRAAGAATRPLGDGAGTGPLSEAVSVSGGTARGQPVQRRLPGTTVRRLSRRRDPSGETSDRPATATPDDGTGSEPDSDCECQAGDGEQHRSDASVSAP